MGANGSCCIAEDDSHIMVTKMDLSHCGCIEVPNEIFRNPEIENLILSSNQISSLAPQLFHCQELKHLNLSDNCLDTIPEAIGNLHNLLSLKLDKNNLTSLPENLKKCRRLKRLSLNNNNCIKNILEVVTKLISVQDLYLNHCDLKFINASVGRLNRLKVIELRNNCLCNLPLSLSRLNQLTRLDIGDNEFVEFPQCIINIPTLVELYMDNNEIEEIINLESLKQLKHLDISFNNIVQVHEGIGQCVQLNMLNLSHNFIEKIPHSIHNLALLEYLNIESNELSSVTNNIGKLSSLYDLNLSTNQLNILPPSIGLLRNLKYFNVSNNLIEELPNEIGSCSNLTILNLSYNRLQLLPSEIGYLHNLVVLNVIGNFLMYLPLTFNNLSRIKAIWLSGNQNVPLIPFVQEAHGLTNITLPQVGETYNIEKLYSKSNTWSQVGRKIRFAEEEDSLPGKLHRTPTPFPKELRAPYKRKQMEATTKNDNYVNVINGQVCDEGMLQPPSDKPGISTVIREANIRKSVEKEKVFHRNDEDEGEVARDAETIDMDAGVEPDLGTSNQDTNNQEFKKVDVIYHNLYRNDEQPKTEEHLQYYSDKIFSGNEKRNTHEYHHENIGEHGELESNETIHQTKAKTEQYLGDDYYSNDVVDEVHNIAYNNFGKESCNLQHTKSDQMRFQNYEQDAHHVENVESYQHEKENLHLPDYRAMKTMYNVDERYENSQEKTNMAEREFQHIEPILDPQMVRRMYHNDILLDSNLDLGTPQMSCLYQNTTDINSPSPHSSVQKQRRVSTDQWKRDISFNSPQKFNETVKNDVPRSQNKSGQIPSSHKSAFSSQNVKPYTSTQLYSDERYFNQESQLNEMKEEKEIANILADKNTSMELKSNLTPKFNNPALDVSSLPPYELKNKFTGQVDDLQCNTQLQKDRTYVSVPYSNSVQLNNRVNDSNSYDNSQQSDSYPCYNAISHNESFKPQFKNPMQFEKDQSLYEARKNRSLDTTNVDKSLQGKTYRLTTFSASPQLRNPMEQSPQPRNPIEQSPQSRTRNPSQYSPQPYYNNPMQSSPQLHNRNSIQPSQHLQSRNPNYLNPMPQNINSSPQLHDRNANEQDRYLYEARQSKLTEEMCNRNMSPPCYEIAKMYSTKAAFFQKQHELRNQRSAIDN